MRTVTLRIPVPQFNSKWAARRRQIRARWRDVRRNAKHMGANVFLVVEDDWEDRKLFPHPIDRSTGSRLPRKYRRILERGLYKDYLSNPVINNAYPWTELP